METRKRLRWIEQRDFGYSESEYVEILAELSPDGWEFFERDSMSENWHRVSPTKQRAYTLKAIQQLIEQQPITPECQLTRQADVLDKLESQFSPSEMFPF